MGGHVTAGISGYGEWEGQIKSGELRALGIRLSGKSDTTAAQDLEPEYVAISPDGSKAYVTFQENNAVGVVNLTDRQPPLASGAFGYNSGVHGSLLPGRTWSLELTRQF